ncbi:MAG: BamA/TamA family outer membrane protein [Bacteroidota bacterium]
MSQTKSWDIEQVSVHGLQRLTFPSSLKQQIQQLADSITVSSLLGRFANEKRSEGWLEFSLREIKKEPNELLLYFHEGNQYWLQKLSLNGLGDAFVARARLDRWIKKPRPLNWEQLESDLESCLTLFQEEGYPFASFQRTDVAYQKKEGRILTQVSYQFLTGPLIKIDSIEIKGNIRENPAFVHGLIRLRRGDIYQERRITDIPRILNNSIYYQKVKAAKVTFTPFETARLILEMEQKKSGKFDLLLGFLPNPDPGSDRRLRVTGRGEVLLVSPLKSGEIIQLKYESLIEGTTNVLVGLKLPYILRTPFKASGELNIYRQEDDFININTNFSGIYSFNPFLEGQLYFDRRQTILQGDSAKYSTISSPIELDGNRTLAGGGLTYQNLDYRLNPSKGWDVILRVGAGQKSISENPFAPESWYEGRPVVQPIQQVEIEAHRFFNLFPRNVLHLANETKWFGAREYFRNDQWQLGGSQSIRGFNENQFFADFYSFSTLEYRFQLERNSYLVGFLDYAWLRDRAQQTTTQPLGLGVGMNYGTNAGIISITYAVGRTQTESFRPSSGKIHIGFVNQF